MTNPTQINDSPLADRRCSATVPVATAEQIGRWLAQIPRWKIENRVLARTFDFKNYHQTIAFVNAVAWIAHQQDHHPDLTVSYNQCIVAFSTHAVGGISENDFICAAKVHALGSV